MASSMKPRVALTSLCLLSLLAVACGGAVDRTGLFADGGASDDGDGGPGAPPGPCEASPSCGEGGHEVPNGQCPAGARCTVMTTCGVTITCSSHGEICAAIPACPSGFKQVQVCPKDVKCIQQTECGITILCYDPIQCAGAVGCDPGDDQVKTENDCYEDGYCYSRDICGTTIWCTGFRSPTRDAGGGA